MSWIKEKKLKEGTELKRISDQKRFIITNIKNVSPFGKPEKEYELTLKGSTASLKSNIHFLGCYWELVQ